MTTWQSRIDDVWARADEVEPSELVRLVDEAVGDAPAGPAAFERAGSFDATDRPELAEPLYREALRHRLDPEVRARAVIQLASTVRNLGRPDEAVTLLTDLLDDDAAGLGDAAVAFRALALADLGDERRGLADVLAAFAPHLPAYTRSVSAYAEELGAQGTKR
ncbi:hypothetical protein ASD11_03155 [Aeromicrobium sp. Root495]|uniref:tetratricopeptide repeat protein n=1 Tax=Aeromicrobium sp. Root495 TaxID=1736550 RepID=UPI0006F79DC5|nr:tetratricopeptide repeat protein [Aeromicrobium sp. Root495]KQY58666.1 hypothetical protein ASD11_03155 [Aeromicrobium sp. Root495]